MSLCELLGIDEPVEVVEEPVQKAQKLTPFDFVNAISYGKDDLFNEHDDAEKAYNAYVVNRALSFSPDMVLFANEMNMYPHTPARMQFEFLKSSIRKKKRYDKWVKAEKESEDIAVIKEYYGYSNEKAKQALLMLAPHEIDELKTRMFKGGIVGKQKKSRKKETDE